MIKLKDVIKQLEKQRKEAIECVADTISLTAQAGMMISKARAQGENMDELFDSVGITNEQAKRYEKVSMYQHKLADGDPALVRQVMLFSELLPDPISSSVPSEPKPLLWQVIKFGQWLANRCKCQAWPLADCLEFVQLENQVLSKSIEVKERIAFLQNKGQK